MPTTIDPPLTVLLAEDNPNDAMLIKRYIQQADTAFLPDRIEIHHEEDLDSALDVLDTEEIDLFLLDLGLPGSSGPETYHRVSETTEDIPVIILTGLQDEQAAVDLLQQGAQDYLNKESLEEGRLVKSIRYALERQEREAALRLKTEQFELLNRILRHDIQNDVQVIRGWTEAVAQQASDDAAARLEKVIETSEHIVELTENSRDLMQLIAGEGGIELEPISLDKLLREELDKARSAHTETEFSLTDSLPTVTVQANQMLSSVFRNLLNNAVQHNKSETPTVAVTLEDRGETVRVTIVDNGPGIPDDEKDAVFGKGARGLESDGTGIGLYLVDTLSAEFGGRVWVADGDERDYPGDGDRLDDTDLTGAAFTLELPVAEPAN